MGISLSVLLYVPARDRPAIVQGVSWKRAISYEKVTWVHETSEVGFPPDCRNRRTCKKKYEDRPKEVTVYDYEVKRWGYSRTVEANGTKRETIKWPTHEPYPNEKEKDRFEIYNMIFAYNKKTYVKAVNYDEWSTIKEGDPYILKVSLLGRIIRIISDDSFPPMTSPRQIAGASPGIIRIIPGNSPHSDETLKDDINPISCPSCNHVRDPQQAFCGMCGMSFRSASTEQTM